MAQLTGVLQIAIPVKDADRASAFYAEKLGMELLFKPSPTMAFLQCGEVRIYLEAKPSGGGEAGANTMIYFRTTDIDGAHASFKERGVEIQEPPHLIARLPDREVWLMWVRDSESNLLGVMQEKPAAP
jgi:predicted enzyme related to lactoylglutathione lyase